MHVLSTPPAFILSQDQTLMLKVFPTNPMDSFSDKIWLNQKHLFPIYCFKVTSINRSVRLSTKLVCFDSLKLSLLESFKVYSLFSYQGSIASTSWSYQSCFCRKFVSSDSLLTISPQNLFVNNFFLF